MALFDFWKRREPIMPTSAPNAGMPPADIDTYLPELAVRNSPDGKFTSIEGDDLLLELPFRWEQVHNELSLEYRNCTFSEQLIITARRTRENLSIQDRGLLLAKIVEVHQDALKKSTSGEIQMSAPEQVNRGQESEGRFYAKSTEMMMAFGVRYIPDRVFTFALYRYTHQRDFGMPFGEYAGAILDLLKVKPRRIGS
jgi:hypothetical protein